MIPTQNHQPRGGARVRLIVLHTTEGARDVASLGHYFQTGTDQASYHVAFDDQRTEQYVLYNDAAWAIMSGNAISDNGAFCGAHDTAWTRAEWLAHPAMLELAAAWVAQRCMARGVPLRRLSPAEVKACAADAHHPGGVIMHRDWTQGIGEGDHKDCGDGFPWDVLLTRAHQLAGDNDMSFTDDDRKRLQASGHRNEQAFAVVFAQLDELKALILAHVSGDAAAKSPTVKP